MKIKPVRENTGRQEKGRGKAEGGNAKLRRRKNQKVSVREMQKSRVFLYLQAKQKKEN
jgi:hypothetical protein